MNIDTSRASPNHSARGGNRVRALVIHATAGSWQGALSWLCNPASKVSAHYLVRKDGYIWRLVPEDRTAWHAGVSQWRGLEVWSMRADGVRVPSLNPTSVGIELENLNNGKDPYPEAQYQACLWLSRQIVARHGIHREHVVRHLDIAPGRKTDPAGFPWERFLADLVPADAAPHARLYRTRAASWVRRAAKAAGPALRVLTRGEVVAVTALVTGERLDLAGYGASDQWAQLADGGYVWLPQLEAA